MMTVGHVGGEHPAESTHDPVPGDQAPAAPATTGRVSFVGAGPGAADLITLRGARRIAQADLVIWSASLVPAESVQEHVRAGAELVDSSRLGREELVELYRRAERERLSVARVHSGDPTMWGAVQEQYDACVRMRLDVEIVPGVTGFSAAAASIGKELTAADADQPVMVSRMDGGKVAMPERASIVEFAQRGATMALSVSAARTGRLVEELRDGGYHDDVPVVVAHKPSAPDELLVRTTLGELQATVKHHKLWRNTLFLVGRALAETGSARRSSAAFRRADSSASGGGAEGARRREAPRATDARADRPGRARTRRGSPSAGEAVIAAHADAEVAEAVPEPRVQDVRKPGQPDSAVAWWAVRDWQRTARDAARAAAARASSRSGIADSAQPELFGGHDAVAAEASDVDAPVDEPVPAGPEQAADRDASVDREASVDRDDRADQETAVDQDRSAAPEASLADPADAGGDSAPAAPADSEPQGGAAAHDDEDAGSSHEDAVASGRSSANAQDAASAQAGKSRAKSATSGKGRGSGKSSGSKTQSATTGSGTKSKSAKSSTSQRKSATGSTDSSRSGQ